MGLVVQWMDLWGPEKNGRKSTGFTGVNFHPTYRSYRSYFTPVMTGDFGGPPWILQSEAPG